MLDRGLDVIFAEPGDTADFLCGVCATRMHVEQNVLTATSFSAAMAGIKHRVDIHKCPYAEEKWHQQAKALIRAIDECPSTILANLMSNELRAIIATHATTKDSWK